MKRVLVALLGVFAIAIVSAGSSNDKLPFDPSPETTVTCWRGTVTTFSAPEGIDQSRCQAWSDNACADCIVSLEQHGCKVIRAVERQPYDVAGVDGVQLLAEFSYFVSCVEP